MNNAILKAGHVTTVRQDHYFTTQLLKKKKKKSADKTELNYEECKKTAETKKWRFWLLHKQERIKFLN